MSESAPEGGGGGLRGLFTAKIGPLPTWGWIGIAGGGLVVWRLWADHQASSSNSAGSAADTTSAADVPQFVNQTYTTVTAPAAGPPPNQPITTLTPPAGAPVKVGASGEQLTRNWTSEGGSTLAQVSQRLLGNANVGNLKPANQAASAWLAGPYAKNHNAKMPKGLVFTYNQGAVTAKT